MTPAIDAATRLCAVIGNPVGHSLSPHMHNAAYRAAGLNFVYLAFGVEDPGPLLAAMRTMPNLRGLSVTIPHKRTVMAHLDEIDPMAAHVGSVNTITNDNGRLVGSTTDGPGALRAFEEAGTTLTGKRVLFLGTGGATRAVAFAAAEMGGASAVTILGRTAANVDSLVDDLRAKTDCAVAGGALDASLPRRLAEHDVIVNGTPLGMQPDVETTPVPHGGLEARHWVFDMVYRPHRTRLIRDAEAAGCGIVFGIEMLIHQAALQFERWTGTPCPAEAMRTAAMAVLDRR